MIHEVWSIEDSHHDQEALRRALRRWGGEVSLVQILDGDSAMDRVKQLGRAADELPDLVLLDLNLGRTSGFEVLDRLKGDAALRRVPVVVLTSSLSSRDVSAAYDSGANAVIQKPLALADFYEVVERTADFWLDVAAPSTKELNQ